MKAPMTVEEACKGKVIGDSGSVSETNGGGGGGGDTTKMSDDDWLSIINR